MTGPLYRTAVPRETGNTMTDKTQTREHDFTQNAWGHNLNITGWDSAERRGKAVCWVTPGLRNGDIVIVRSENGTMRLEAFDVESVFGVDDMYRFAIRPVEGV